MSRTVIIACDRCKHVRTIEHGEPPDPVRVKVFRGDPVKSSPERELDLCESCLGYFIGWARLAPCDVSIPFRGSLTDLATDVAFEITPRQARVFIDELERFLTSDLSKFKEP